MNGQTHGTQDRGSAAELCAATQKLLQFPELLFFAQVGLHQIASMTTQ